jgi:hypothetical protein
MSVCEGDIMIGHIQRIVTTIGGQYNTPLIGISRLDGMTALGTIRQIIMWSRFVIVNGTADFRDCGYLGGRIGMVKAFGIVIIR